MKSFTLTSILTIAALSAIGAQAATSLGTIDITGGDRFPGYLGVYGDGNAYQYVFTGSSTSTPTALSSLGSYTPGKKYNFSAYWMDATLVTSSPGVYVDIDSIQQVEAPAGYKTSEVYGFEVVPNATVSHPFGDTYFNTTGITTTTHTASGAGTLYTSGEINPATGKPYTTLDVNGQNIAAGSVLAGANKSNPYGLVTLETAQSAFGASDTQSEELASLLQYTDAQLKASGGVTNWTGYYQGATLGGGLGSTESPTENVILAAEQLAAFKILGFSSAYSSGGVTGNTPGPNTYFTLAGYNPATNPVTTCTPGPGNVSTCMNLDGWSNAAYTYAVDHANSNISAVVAVDTVDGTVGDLVVGEYTAKQGVILSPVTIASGVPEPAAWTMMILGVGGLGLVLRRRRARDRHCAAVVV